MKFTLMLSALVAGSACAYHAPSAPTPLPLPTSSTAPASVQLTGATRPDRDTDLTASVYTSAGHPVADVLVEFTTSTGTLEPPSAVTDANGRARTVLNATATAVVSVTAGALSASTTILATAPVPMPPPAPIPGPTPAPPPTAPFGITLRADARPVGEITTFGLAGSPITQAIWDVGDGSAAFTTSAPTLQHVYTRAGTFRAGVTVSDVSGRRASSALTVTVAPQPDPPHPPPPSLSVSLTCTPVPHGQPTPCNITVTDQHGDPITANLASSVDWDWGDGQTQSGGVVMTHTYTNAGTYTVIARATYRGVSGMASKIITIT
jgi:PKD repeat protein